MSALPNQYKSKLPFLGLALFLFVFPDIASASGGITEFSSPLEQVVNTITGPDCFFSASHSFSLFSPT